MIVLQNMWGKCYFCLQDLHESMTANELNYYFGVSDPADVPEYEVITLADPADQPDCEFFAFGRWDYVMYNASYYARARECLNNKSIL